MSAETQLLDHLRYANRLAYTWQDDRRQDVEKRLGVAAGEQERVIDDREYRQVMDAVALVRDAFDAVRKLTEQEA